MAKVDRFLAGPVPERSAPVTVLVADPSDAVADDENVDDSEPSPTPGATPAPTTEPDGCPARSSCPTATPKPTPARVAVDVDIVQEPQEGLRPRATRTWCAPAGVQMVLAILGKGDTSDATSSARLQGRVHEWESSSDSHNGDWGPSAMALALDAYGVPGYEVRAYKTRQGALRDAAGRSRGPARRSSCWPGVAPTPG